MEDIRVYAGQGAVIPVTVTDQNGDVVNISGKTLALSAVDKWSTTPGQTVAVVPTVVDGPSGTAEVPFTDTDTSSLVLDGGLLRLKFYMTMTDGVLDPLVIATGVLHVIEP